MGLRAALVISPDTGQGNRQCWAHKVNLQCAPTQANCLSRGGFLFLGRRGKPADLGPGSKHPGPGLATQPQLAKPLGCSESSAWGWLPGSDPALDLTSRWTPSPGRSFDSICPTKHLLQNRYGHPCSTWPLTPAPDKPASLGRSHFLWAIPHGHSRS